MYVSLEEGGAGGAAVHKCSSQSLFLKGAGQDTECVKQGWKIFKMPRYRAAVQPYHLQKHGLAAGEDAPQVMGWAPYSTLNWL